METNEFSDMVLECCDCGTEFTWTAGEQQFFESRGLMHRPRRCKPCRVAKQLRGDYPTIRGPR